MDDFEAWMWGKRVQVTRGIGRIGLECMRRDLLVSPNRVPRSREVDHAGPETQDKLIYSTVYGGACPYQVLMGDE